MEIDELNETESIENETVVVRTMRDGDLDAVVRIDESSSGRRRPEYFKLMVERAVRQAAMQISLVAELDGRVVGFAIGSLFFGEYGILEPTASIDVIGVDPKARRQHVGKTLMRQLRLHLSALGVTVIRTEVEWSDFNLLSFFKSEGFGPVARLCLEHRVDPTKV
jgi:ribosomal protein S18 acetylase RimI-like enzyme